MTRVLVIFAGLLLVIICFASLSCYALEGSFTMQYKPLARQKHVKNELKGLQEVHVRSFQKRGKGSYGGGDLLRPRNGHRNGAASAALKPSCFLRASVHRYVLPGLFIFVAFF